ncbi:MAG: D-alanyl-D-alanine carboxypeptidase, partial [Thermoleophilaceae bacterium]
MPRPLATLLALAALLAAAPSAAAADDALVRTLTRQMRAAGAHSGAYVVNVSQGETVFSWKPNSPRILASNTKLFTTAAALARYGSDGTLGTEVLGDSELGDDGVWHGDLYLRGGGDPTFGSRRFVTRNYGQGATVEKLAALIEDTGIERVTGRVYGDESRFDSLRGGPESRYATSIWVGPLSGLAFNRGLGDEQGRSFQLDPPLFAAARLDAALERRGVKVRLAPRAGLAAAGAEVLASVDSPPMGRLIALTNKTSDNFFAEMLLKDLALQARGRGSTAAGAKVAAGFARRLGSGA